MAHRTRRSFLDRPIARVLAGMAFLGCVGTLGYIERERLWQAADQGAADGPFERCFAERAADIDQMVAENTIDEAQAELFKTRAEAMCRATVEGSGGGASPVPAR